IDVHEENTGSIIESMGTRKGEMLDMVTTGNGQTRLTFLIPARGLIGYRTEFMSLTRGYGIINHTFEEYRPLVKGRIGGRRNGVLVSIDKGAASTYSILALEGRGTNFMEPGTEVYEGMIAAENSPENDLGVNITKVKPANSMPTTTKDQTTTRKKPRTLTL